MIKKLFNKKTAPAILFGFLVLILLINTNTSVDSDNDASRVATIKAIVEHKTLAINNVDYKTVDVIKREDNFYSTKPPVLTVIGGGFYFILNKTGLDLPGSYPQENPETNLAYYFLSLFLVGIPYLLLVYFFYKSTKIFFDLKTKYSLLLTSGLALGTLVFSYSVTINNHIPGAMFLFLGFYFFMLYIKDNPKNEYKNLILAGLFSALAGVVSTFGPVFFIIYCVYLFFENISKKFQIKKLLTFIALALPVIALHLLLNYQITGDLLPARAHPEFYNYENSYWTNPQSNEAIGDFVQNNIIGDKIDHSFLQYSFNSLIGGRGILLYTPLLILSIIAIVKILASSGKAYKKGARLVTIGFLIVLSYYASVANGYGGSSFGFRWFIAITPLLYFFTPYLFRKKPSFGLIIIFLALLAFSMAVAIFGYLDPWSSIYTRHL